MLFIYSFIYLFILQSQSYRDDNIFCLFYVLLDKDVEKCVEKNNRKMKNYKRKKERKKKRYFEINLYRWRFQAVQ